jgi:hypothetical protein
MIAGHAVASICIATLGLPWTYTIDFFTFFFSLAALLQIKSLPVAETEERPSIKSIGVAIRYAVGRSELLDTYIVDFVAMVFAMPFAIFPALAVMFGGTKTLGWFYAAPAIGALFVTIFSAWTHKIKRHGAAVAVAAIKLRSSSSDCS